MRKFIIRKRFLFSAAVLIYLTGLSLYTITDYYSKKKLHEKVLIDSALITLSECKTSILTVPDFSKIGIYAFYGDRILKRNDADFLGVLDLSSGFEFFRDRNGKISQNKKLQETIRQMLSSTGLSRGEIRVPYGKKGFYRIFYDFADEKRYILTAAGFEESKLKDDLNAELFKNIRVHLFFLMLLLPFIIILIYVEEREKKLLLERIYTERLTGFPNRTKMFLDIESCAEPSLFIVNIDSFKEFNDLYGFEVGDFIILETGRRLDVLCRDKIGQGVSLYKLQADEYAIMICEKKTDEDLSFIAGNVIAAVNESPYSYKGYEMSVSVTVGITKTLTASFQSEEEKRLHSAVSRADMALKKAKSDRRHFLLYDESMNIRQEYEENIQITKLIKNAIKDGGIIPYFQPIVNNSNLEVEKYESLVRIQEKEGKIIHPSVFLHVAKKTKLYSMLTRIISEKTFSYFKDKDYGVSVNLSVDDILNDETVEYIIDLLSIYGDKIKNKVTFEIVESEGIENFGKVKEFIAKIKDVGCGIAIDDFGTGYSNFSYIGELNIDYIKIDASMIKNITSDKNSRIITETIVGFCQKMGIRTVAEFVHSKEVFEIVRSIGIDFSQGYYFGQPAETIKQQ